MAGPAREYNFDGLIGPTHNYAGLSYGNVASATHQHQTAHPRAAALQGLAKMKRLADLGIGQAVLPPLRRPASTFLARLGFEGPWPAVVDQVLQVDPGLLAASYSASNMWTANAATVSPSADCEDGRVHLTTANLCSTLHRSIEAEGTFGNLKRIFGDLQQFAVHPALPGHASLSDEGAANHTRLQAPGPGPSSPGLELFVYGIDRRQPAAMAPTRYPARQTRRASELIARRHGLAPANFLLIQQHPAAIDAGVFHNDVISVGHQNVLICHQQAFCDQPAVLAEIRRRYRTICGVDLQVYEFSEDEISLTDAVRSYLFNSQLVTRPDQGMTLICPSECQSLDAARRCTERLVEQDGPIDQVEFLGLRQSMNNGGGPACLRLRVALTETEAAGLPETVWLTETRYAQLVTWVQRHYREALAPDDLRDPQLASEAEQACDALESIFGFPLA